MKRFFASGLALAFALLIVAVFARTPVAQTADGTPAACAPERQEISAAALPDSTDPGKCETEGRPIVDGAVGAVLPSPGNGVYVEALTTSGTQELEIKHLRNGAIELEHVGNESRDASEAGTAFPASSKAPGECGDAAYQSNDQRIASGLAYRINYRTTPAEISRLSAIAAIRKAGGNVADTVNGCKLGDRVPAGVSYKGLSTTNASISSTGGCTRNDRLSVVSFGRLSGGVLAVTCNYFGLNPGFNSVNTSDIKVNSVSFRWTTSPRAKSCRSAYDLEAVVTHERGHSFGLGHIPERAHRNLTMSPLINGPCQGSERSLGRGDVIGLDRKYP